jgi:hypothetical protein
MPTLSATDLAPASPFGEGAHVDALQAELARQRIRVQGMRSRLQAITDAYNAEAGPLRIALGQAEQAAKALDAAIERVRTQVDPSDLAPTDADGNIFDEDDEDDDS